MGIMGRSWGGRLDHIGAGGVGVVALDQLNWRAKQWRRLVVARLALRYGGARLANHLALRAGVQMRIAFGDGELAADADLQRAGLAGDAGDGGLDALAVARLQQFFGECRAYL